jgi:hypothetical protein
MFKIQIQIVFVNTWVKVQNKGNSAENSKNPLVYQITHHKTWVRIKRKKHRTLIEQ